jgi:hypothetical protein
MRDAPFQAPFMALPMVSLHRQAIRGLQRIMRRASEEECRSQGQLQSKIEQPSTDQAGRTKRLMAAAVGAARWKTHPWAPRRLIELN